MLFLHVFACSLPLETLSEPKTAGAGGADWVDLGDPLTAVTVSAASRGTCEAWATTGAGNLLHSEDSGRTWEILAAGDGSNSLLAIARQGSEVWAVGRQGRVVRVTEEGVSDSSNGVEDLTDVVLYPGDGALRAWAVGRSGAVRYTTNGGDQWERAAPTTADLHAVALAPALASAGAPTPAVPEVWVAGSAGALWRSPDGGRSWVPETLPDAASTTDLLSLDFGPDGTGWATGADGTVATRSPGGAWSTTQLEQRARMYTITPLRHLLDGALEAAVGGNGGVLAVRQVGGPWTEAVWKAARPLTSWNDIAADQRCILAVGDDGAVATADLRGGADGLPTWSVVRSGWRPGLNAISAARDGEALDALAVGRSGTALRLRERRWELVDPGTQSNLLTVDLFQPENGWVAGLGALLRLSGDSWTPLTLPPEIDETAAIVAVDAVNASSAWAWTRGGQLLYAADFLGVKLVSSTDPGVVSGCASGDTLLTATARAIHRYRVDLDTWDHPPFPDASIRALRCGDGGQAWVLASQNPRWVIYESGDAGETWSLTNAESAEDLFGLTVAEDGRRGLAVGASGSAVATSDAWASAAQALGPRADVFEASQGVPRLRAAAVVGEDAWAVGDGLALLAADGSDTWRDVSPTFRSIIDTKDETIVVTDGSWLLSSRDAGRTWQPAPGCGVMGIRDGVAHAGGVLLVGEHGALVERRGGTCSGSSLRGPGGNALADDIELRAAAESDGDLWIVGAGGAVFRGTPAQGFVRIDWPTDADRVPVDLNDVAVRDGVVWIAGDDGVLLRWDGEALSVVQVPTDRWERDPPLRDDLRGVRVTSTGELWVVGEHGTALQSLDGDLWRTRHLPVTEDLEDIVFDDAVGWIVGARGTVLETRDRGHTWEDVSGSSRANLQAVTFGGGLRAGGLIVGDRATLLQAHRVAPPPDVDSGGAVWTPGALTWDLRWVDDPGATLRYRATEMHLRQSGQPWDDVAFSAGPSGAGLHLVVPSREGPASKLRAGDAFQARVTLTDGRRSWEVLLAESSWQSWLSATPEYLQYGIGLLLFPGFGLGLVWLVRPQALLRAPSDEERGTLQGLIEGAARFLGPWAAPLTLLLQFIVPLQRTARVRDAWLGLYRERSYHLNAVRPSTVGWYLKAPAVQRALIERYRADAFQEVQRALGVDPTEGVLRPPARVRGRGIDGGHLAVFSEARFREGLVHIRASAVEGAPEYLFATALLACAADATQVGAIPIIVHDQDGDILGAVATALRGLFDEADREAVTPTLTTELVGLGCVAVLFTAPTVPEGLLSNMRALRRGWPKALVLVAAERLGTSGADIHVDTTDWPMERALKAVEIVLESEPDAERQKVRERVQVTLTTTFGATSERVDLPPRLVDAVIRRAHDAARPDSSIATDALATWLLEALLAPPTDAAAWLEAAGHLARFGWDAQGHKVRSFRFDGTVQREAGSAAADVLAAAARIGLLVGAVHHGRYEWKFRHAAVARLLAQAGNPT